MSIRNTLIALLVILVTISFAAHRPLAQEDAVNLDVLDKVAPSEPDTPPPTDAAPGANAPQKPATAKHRMSFFEIVHSGGLIGYLIMLLSLVTVALAIEYVMMLRKNVFIPPGFGESVLQLLSQRQLTQAIQQCRNDPSFLAQILYAGMSEYEFGWNAVEKAAEESTADQAGKLYRRVEYLNVIGNIAPMIGLLGTVVGMVMAFQNLAETEGYARATDLAEGIYLALVTTVQGLIVAIPALGAYSYFCSRIASLVSETTYIAEQVLVPVKRSLLLVKKEK